MSKTAAIFRTDKPLIAMVHVAALPGTPRHRQPMDEIVQQAVAEAKLLQECGVDAILLENMHDVPYLKAAVGPEITAAMTAVAAAVRGAVSCPIGIQVLAGANHEALAVAHGIGAQFIRVEGFQFAAVADEGLLETAAAGPLLRFRRSIGAEGIAIIADIKKKHSAHALTADIDIASVAEAAAFMGADGLIVTGTATGDPVNLESLGAVRHATDLPLLVGSGVSPDQASALLGTADGLIVGSSLKHDGNWANAPDPARVRAMVEAVKAAC